MKYIKSHTRRGYTLLFAVLIASLVLGVAVFILSVSRKQYLLSATARESMYAVYASESGIECAALADNAFDPFNSVTETFKCKNFPSNDASITFIAPDLNGPEIYTDTNGDKHSIWYVDDKKHSYLIQKEADFRLAFNDKNDSSIGVYACAVMSILGYNDDVNKDPVTSEDVPVIVVRSRGYNVCKLNTTTNTWGPDTTSPRTVERARELIYR